ncbi:MAG: CapA family protein [Prevotella sp.]|nr:CapA family protein [Prevotella sp.]
MLKTMLFAMLMVTDSVSVTITGDILLDRGVRKVIEQKGTDAVFSPFVDSVFQSSDIVIGNLECPATKIKEPSFKQFIFRAEPEWLFTLKQHGITHLNLANNHSVDQGRAGLVDTRENVVSAGIIPIGAGYTMEEAVRPVLLTSSPRKVYVLASLQLALENFAYLSEKPSVSQEDFDTLVERVRHLRSSEPDSYIIVTLHWGGEHTLQPVTIQRVRAHQLIDAGADALIGHHTHTLQTIEEYKGKPIYYSIGNFIFDQRKPVNTRACMVKLTITKESSHVETIPVEIIKCVPCRGR